MNNPRPSGVTLIGFLGALGSLIALFTAQPDFADFDSMRRVETNPWNPKTEQLYCYLDAGINLFACYFILQAKNWARWLFLAWNGTRLLVALSLPLWKSAAEGPVGFLCFSPGMIITVVVLTISPFLLFRAAGQEYFMNGHKPWWRE